MCSSPVHDSTRDDTSVPATDRFECDSCGQGNFACITFVKSAGERRHGGGLGFDVCRDHPQRLPPSSDDGFYVRGIIAGGLADRDGRLKEGMTSRYFCTYFNSLFLVVTILRFY